MIAKHEFRKKAYLRWLMGKESATDVAGRVELKDDETVDFWVKKISGIRSNGTGSIVAPETAKRLGSALKVTTEQMLNPPESFISPDLDCTDPPLPLAVLKKARGEALVRWMTMRGSPYTSLSLAAVVLPGNGEAEIRAMAADIESWCRGEKLTPAGFLHDLETKVQVLFLCDLVLQYTQDEIDELGITPTVPERRPKLTLPPVPRRTPAAAKSEPKKEASPPVSAATAATPQSVSVQLNREKALQLFENITPQLIRRGDQLFLRMEVPLSMLEFANLIQIPEVS